MDIYSTHFMEMLLREKPQVFTFLRDRYFPEVAIFKTDKVIVDYDDGEGNELAPFVIPEVGKAPMGRSGYETMELAPANIAPSRPLSLNDIKKRRAGESLVSEDTPEMRERKLLVEDLEDKAALTALFEAMEPQLPAPKPKKSKAPKKKN